MSTITIEEDKLEELIEKNVQKHLNLTFDDMEVVRKSPAAAIIRLEDKMENMVTKTEFNKLGEKVSRIEVKIESMVSKTEFREKFSRIEDKIENMVSKTEFNKLGEKVSRIEDKMVTKTEFWEKIAQLEGNISRNNSLVKLLIAVFLSGMGIIGAMFVKMFFL